MWLEKKTEKKNVARKKQKKMWLAGNDGQPFKCKEAKHKRTTKITVALFLLLCNL